jgi:hypothetical protein
LVYDRTHSSEHWKKIDEPAVERALARNEYVRKSDHDGDVVLERSGS